MNKIKNKKALFSIVFIVIAFISGFLFGYIYFSAGGKISLKIGLEKALVTKVVDGDTIVIEGGDSVRLLGMDTPEKGQKFYQEAKDFLTERVLMKEIKLEKDKTGKDQYGRLLRYVWLNSTLINTELVENGLAKALSYDPNIKYKDLIAKKEKEAMDSKIGIWNITNGTIEIAQ